jgi:hypothetical protein
MTHPDSDVIGFLETECDEIVERFQELEGPCVETRAAVLVAQLGKGLESYMDIDRELLSQAFLADFKRKQQFL